VQVEQEIVPMVGTGEAAGTGGVEENNERIATSSESEASSGAAADTGGVEENNERIATSSESS
jgi:hypothetical protein